MKLLAPVAGWILLWLGLHGLRSHACSRTAAFHLLLYLAAAAVCGIAGYVSALRPFVSRQQWLIYIALMVLPVHFDFLLAGAAGTIVAFSFGTLMIVRTRPGTPAKFQHWLLMCVSLGLYPALFGSAVVAVWRCWL